MKKILMIGTGGTIASEMTEAGLVPELTTSEFLKYVPAVRSICDVDCVQLCNIDSTNMTPRHWLAIAAEIERQQAAYDGFVICHGTDTLAYTAAALSYLVQGFRKPVILTGSQKPINSEITDSKTNLIDSFACACDGRIAGVSVVFGEKIILGTRARKSYSKSYGAFSSINYPILGTVLEGHVVPYIQPFVEDRPVFARALDTRVGLLKLIPGCDAAALHFLLGRSDAVIVESFGVGGIPQGETGSFYREIDAAIRAGKTVVMTTQVNNEGSDLAVYNVGHRLKTDLNVLEAYDMTTECVVAKLMWLLAQTKDPCEVERLFYTPVANDLLGRPQS